MQRKIYPHHILTLNKRSWGLLDFIFGFSWVINPPETDFDDFQSNYLGKYEAICKMALALESGP
jgi:hypothetical protein